MPKCFQCKVEVGGGGVMQDEGILLCAKCDDSRQEIGTTFRCHACEGTFSKADVFNAGKGLYVCRECLSKNNKSSPTKQNETEIDPSRQQGLNIKCKACGNLFQITKVWTEDKGLTHICHTCYDQKNQMPLSHKWIWSTIVISGLASLLWYSTKAPSNSNDAMEGLVIMFVSNAVGWGLFLGVIFLMYKHLGK